MTESTKKALARAVNAAQYVRGDARHADTLGQQAIALGLIAVAQAIADLQPGESEIVEPS